ncbi:MAG: IclR family transcriptional regulator [Alphaproteobacteria bacterium]
MTTVVEQEIRATKMPGRSGPETGIKSVHLALDILESLTSSPQGKGVTELARELSTNKARVYRQLQTLRTRGYVEQAHALSKYQVSLRFYLVGQSVAQHFDIISETRKVTPGLRDKVGQSVSVSTCISNRLVCVDLLRGRSPLAISMQLGSSFPLHATAGGKLMIAFGDPKVFDEVFAKTPARLTKKTIIDPNVLRTEIEICRQRGWAMAPEEMQIGINALAVPIFDSDGSLAGTMSILGSIDMIPTDPDPEQVEAIVEAGQVASKHLGWRPTEAPWGPKNTHISEP